MDILRDLPHVMDNHECFFDAWQEGGVDGLVIGPMEFVSADPMPGAGRSEAPDQAPGKGDCCRCESDTAPIRSPYLSSGWV